MDIHCRLPPPQAALYKIQAFHTAVEDDQTTSTAGYQTELHSCNLHAHNHPAKADRTAYKIRRTVLALVPEHFQSLHSVAVLEILQDTEYTAHKKIPDLSRNDNMLPDAPQAVVSVERKDYMLISIISAAGFPA